LGLNALPSPVAHPEDLNWYQPSKWLSGAAISAQTLAHYRTSMELWHVIRNTLFYTPVLVLWAVRYILGVPERFFFTVLADTSPSLAAYLHQLKPATPMTRLWREARRTLKTAMFAAVMFWLYMLPSLTQVAVPLMLVQRMSDVTRQTRLAVLLGFYVMLYQFSAYSLFSSRFLLVFAALHRFSFDRSRTRGLQGNITAFIAAFLLALPFVEPAIMPLISYAVACVAIAIELLDPVFARVNLTDQQLSRLLRTNRWVFVGFIAPVTLLLSMPFVGLMAWGIVQGSAACLFHEMDLSAVPELAVAQQGLEEGADHDRSEYSDGSRASDSEQSEVSMGSSL